MDNDEMLIAIRGIFDKKTDEIKQYVDTKINVQNVLIESLRSYMKAVAEGHGILNDKLDRVEVKVDNIDKKLDSATSDYSSPHNTIPF